MHILVAPDSFKNSLTAVEIAKAIKNGLLSVLPELGVETIPLSDGGEGALDIFLNSTNYQRIAMQANNPVHKPIETCFGWNKETKTAIIEMAAVSGLELIRDSERSPMLTSTYGLGEVIKTVVEKGAIKIILTVGGSATVDGGTGALQAFGVKLLSLQKEISTHGGQILTEITDVLYSENDYSHVELSIATDVENILLGDYGAAKVFGPQKGASVAEVELLEQGMENFVDLLERKTGKSLRYIKGIGAAGGVALGLSYLFNCKFHSGFNLIAEHLDLETAIRNSDLVITGEGSLDEQSLYGKVPGMVANMAKKHHKPVIAVAGGIGDSLSDFKKAGIDYFIPLCDKPMSLEYSLQNTEKLAVKAGERIAYLIAMQKEFTLFK